MDLSFPRPSRSRAYRWGEDGLAGFSDHHQRLCLSLALWNGRDPILKERLFGLTNTEGNHGEDCKELYYYLDANPTHAYLKMLYKYPQGEFPYADLVETNRSRGKHEREYELIDTGIFDEDRYFDIFVEYARINPTAVNMLVTVWNRGPDEATLHLLPQLWFRNTWWWKFGAKRPRISARDPQSVDVIHHEMGAFQFFVEKADEWLFTENETNASRLFGEDVEGYFKDAFHEYVVNGNAAATNPERIGTKVAAHLVRSVSPGGCLQLRACLRDTSENDPFEAFAEVINARRTEADAFYNELQIDFSPTTACAPWQRSTKLIRTYSLVAEVKWAFAISQPNPIRESSAGTQIAATHLDAKLSPRRIAREIS